VSNLGTNGWALLTVPHHTHTWAQKHICWHLRYWIHKPIYLEFQILAHEEKRESSEVRVGRGKILQKRRPCLTKGGSGANYPLQRARNINTVHQKKWGIKYRCSKTVKFAWKWQINFWYFPSHHLFEKAYNLMCLGYKIIQNYISSSVFTFATYPMKVMLCGFGLLGESYIERSRISWNTCFLL
jgi:hypothetical protein